MLFLLHGVLGGKYVFEIVFSPCLRFDFFHAAHHDVARYKIISTYIFCSPGRLGSNGGRKLRLGPKLFFRLPSPSA